MNGDRPFFGITLMLGFCILAPLADAIAKLLSDRISLLQLLTVRFIIQAIILVPLVWLSGSKLLISRRITILAAVRTVLHIAGIGGMFLSLRYLPLADAIAIAFVMPFIMLLLGKTILKEEVGAHRLAACAVGFVGTLLVIQPNFASVGWPALLPLLVAVDFAFFMLITRQIAKDIAPVPLQALNGIMASAVLVPLLLSNIGSGSIVGIKLPSGTDIGLLLSLGVIGTVAHLLMTGSLKYAPSATLAPMQYLEIPVATFLGWLIFNDLPDNLAALGIAITVAAGLYIVWRERVRSLTVLRQQGVAPPAAE